VDACARLGRSYEFAACLLPAGCRPDRAQLGFWRSGEDYLLYFRPGVAYGGPGPRPAAAPRTAVGVRYDGSVIFYTIDGRRSGYSVGASMDQVARRMIELGCVTALCLDGGGSTTLAVTAPDKLETGTVNRPSDGAERKVSNQVFLVAPNQPTGELSHFYVQADNQYVLAGSKVTISASAVDTNFIPMQEDYRLETDGGQLDGNVLTTPLSGGEVTVTAGSGD